MSLNRKKIAFVFPGQGAQYIGMGIDFLKNNLDFQKVFDSFKTKTGYDLQAIMSEGPEDRLRETRFTQPAILAHSIMALKTFVKKHDIQPSFVAGHSLGEFSALVANDVLSFSDALYLVHKRGEFMIKASEGVPFAMAAIIGLESETIKAICAEVSKQHVVVAANFNTPTQTVISGTQTGVELAGVMAKDLKAKRVAPLVVGGAFHSPLVAKASDMLLSEMHKIKFSDAQIPVINNVHAKPETSATKIVKNLTEQVTSSVRWVETIKYLEQQGVEVYIEFGPKKVLSGMISSIVENAVTYNIDKLEDIELVVSE
jgi:[acyl-carrier-protein] S-malonyltransferase